VKRPKLVKSEMKNVRKTINTKEIQGIIRDYFNKLYSNKLENLEKWTNF
jgi:hypothetical protein